MSGVFCRGFFASRSRTRIALLLSLGRLKMKRLEEDEWCTMLCEPVPFTVHKMCVFYRLWFFPSTPGVSVRVLRPMFVPGCGGAPWICQLCVFLSFSLCCHPPPHTSVYHLSSPCSINFCRLLSRWLATIVSSQVLFILFPLSFHSPLPLPPFFLPSLLFLPPPPPPCAFPPLSSLPRRSHGSLVVRLLEGIPTPPPPPLEPLSLLSLRPLPRSLRCFFFSLPSPLLSLSLFSSSLFNVEVLSNCWLLLWLGGNGIFRRMPHAVALTHSWVSPDLTHTHTHTHTHRHQDRSIQAGGTLTCMYLHYKNAQSRNMHAKTEKLQFWVSKNYVPRWAQEWSCTFTSI